jgi:multiple sugar transport system permease protein/N,N'-diacetylchitobiose transport system permease protein
MNAPTTTATQPPRAAEYDATGRRGRAATRKTPRDRARWGWNTLAVLLSALFGLPIYWMIITAFMTGTDLSKSTPQFFPLHPSLASFRHVVSDPVFRHNLVNTVIITVSAVVISLIVGFFGSLAIARFRFVGRRIFVLVVLTVQMIPLVALTIPLSLLLDSYHLKNTIVGVVLAYLIFAMPYTVWTLRAFIAGIPKELDESAMVDGCSRWGTFFRIILPLTGPGLVATGVYCWVIAWNEFVVANTLLLDNNKQTLMIYLLNFQASSTHGADYGGLMAAATLTSLPAVVLFLIFQRRITSGLTAGAVKG